MLSYTIKNLELMTFFKSALVFGFSFALIFFAKIIIILIKKAAINAAFGYYLILKETAVADEFSQYRIGRNCIHICFQEVL